MHNFRHFLSCFRRISSSPAPVSPGRRTVWLGQPQSDRSATTEQQFWMPFSGAGPGTGDLLFGLLRIDPLPSEFLEADPPQVILSVRFLGPFSTLPHVAAFSIGQAGLEVRAIAIGCDGLQISVQARSAPISRDVTFGWVARGPLTRDPDLTARSPVRAGVMAEWKLIESLFGPPSPAGESADAAPFQGKPQAASADAFPSTSHLRPLRYGEPGRLAECTNHRQRRSDRTSQDDDPVQADTSPAPRSLASRVGLR